MAIGRGASVARSGERPARRVPVVEGFDEVVVAPAVSMLAIEYRPVGGLAVYARHARTHDARQLSQIAASMRE